MKRTSIIIGFLSSALALSACSSDKTPTEPAAAKPADTAQAKPAAALTPTTEQQNAARQLLHQTGNAAPPAQSSPSAAKPVDPDMLGIPEIDDLTPGTSNQPPVNLRGFRNPVPQEEAASRRDNAAPAPNAVELRGLRSPSMPTTLPMDITGKQTTSDTP